MRVLVVGASRGTGAELVRELADRGHLVTAFARHPGADDGRATVVTGDAMDADAVAKSVSGQDAVVVTLGITGNPFRVRLTRRAGTPLTIRSAGTANVIAAMQAQGVSRLVVQTTYGIGETYGDLPLALKAFFTLAIRPQVDDHAVQEAAVRSSGLAWTIVRPVVLHDEPIDAPAQVSPDDRVPAMRVSRRQVARVEADALERVDWHNRVLSVSQ